MLQPTAFGQQLLHRVRDGEHIFHRALVRKPLQKILPVQRALLVANPLGMLLMKVELLQNVRRILNHNLRVRHLGHAPLAHKRLKQVPLPRRVNDTRRVALLNQVVHANERLVRHNHLGQHGPIRRRQLPKERVASALLPGLQDQLAEMFALAREKKRKKKERKTAKRKQEKKQDVMAYLWRSFCRLGGLEHGLLPLGGVPHLVDFLVDAFDHVSKGSKEGENRKRRPLKAGY